MVNSWPKVKFGSIYKEPSRNGLTKPKKVRGEGYKFINMGEIFAFDRMDNIPCDRVPLTDQEKASSLLKDGDLLFARQSLVLSGAGKCSIFLGDNEEVAFESHLIRVRLDTEKVNPEYAYYYFRSPQGRANIATIVEQGAGQAGIRGSDLEKLDFPLPPLNVQNSIVEAVRPCDLKLEINQATNQTLEQMAQALFKSWFVDFDPVIDNALAAGNEIPEALQHKAEQRKHAQQLPDFNPLPDNIRELFPCEFEESEIGLIPKGWNIKPADEIADIAIGKTPPRKQKEWFSEQRDGNVVWVSIRDMGAESAFIDDSSEYLTPESISKFNIKVVPKDSVILSFKMTLGRVCIASCDLATNEAIAHFVNPKFGLTKEYIYSYLKAFDYDLLGSTSSIATAVNSKIIKKMPFLVPSVDIVQSFNDSLGRIFSKKLLILEQSRELEKCRDTLLPKLISSQLQLQE